MQLALLILSGILLRIIPIWGNNFPFAYDNAKDSLAIMDMWVTKNPTLLGPVSSLEGLYQGPFWYYLALPMNLLLRFHPLANVLTVLVLGALATALLYKYWGKLAGLLFVISSGVISTQQTAWTPYITMFPALLTLVPLHKLYKKQSLSTSDHCLLFASVGFMLHTEIAFAVVFAIILTLIVIRQKRFPSWRQLFVSLTVFSLFLLPHAAFELKHDFLQTRSVIRFVTHFREESAKISDGGTPLHKLTQVATSISGGLSQSLVPGFIPLNPITSVLITLAFIWFLTQIKSAKDYGKIILFPLLATTFLLYLLLPSKPFYFISLMPFWLVGVALLISSLKATPRKLLLGFLILGALVTAVTSKAEYQRLADTSSILLSSRLRAVEAAYALTQNSQFASYQYVPEVYDFTYQQIYQYTALSKNRVLPTEISYLPGESAYIPWLKRTQQSSDLNVLIVEKDDRPQFFPVWWDKITKNRQIIQTLQVNDAITLYLTQSQEK